MRELKELNILYEDEDIIVCVKPAGVPTQSDRTGDYDLTSQLMNYLAQSRRQAAPEQTIKGGAEEKLPYLAVIHRLDRPVGGVMVFAKNQRSAAVLSRQVQEHRMTKRYYCVLTGCRESVECVQDDAGDAAVCWQTQVDFLTADKRMNLSRIAEKNSKDARRAELRWRGIERYAEPEAELKPGEEPPPELLLAEVELLTGRHHQIRVQMTQVAEGIWGDTRYNPAFTEKKGWYDLALFSHELMFQHPATHRLLQFSAVPEGEVFRRFSYIQRLRER